MINFPFTLALGMMIASCIFTPCAMLVKSDRAIKIGVIAYISSSLAVQELNPRTRSWNRPSEEIDCQR